MRNHGVIIDSVAKHHKQEGPRWYVIFDNWFQTIDSTGQPQVDFDHEDWYKTFGLNPSQYVPDDEDEAPPNGSPVGDAEGAQRIEDMRAIRDARTPRPYWNPSPAWLTFPGFPR